MHGGAGGVQARRRAAELESAEMHARWWRWSPARRSCQGRGGMGLIWARSRPIGPQPFCAARDGGYAAATSWLGSELRRGRP
jgi:hypothetical protein